MTLEFNKHLRGNDLFAETCTAMVAITTSTRSCDMTIFDDVFKLKREKKYTRYKAI